MEKKPKKVIIEIPKENIFFQETDIPFEEEKKALDDRMVEVNVGDINLMEFQYYNKNHEYIQVKNLDDSKSPYLDDIVRETIKLCDLKSLKEPISNFLERNRVSSMEEFFTKVDGNTEWRKIGDWVYPLTPDYIINPSLLQFYKFFLPFRLRHCKPENIPDILYYHKSKYFKDNGERFYAQIKHLLKEKDHSFWFKEDTFERISVWISENKPEGLSIEEEEYFWYELQPKYEKNRKKLVGKLYRIFREVNHEFIDPVIKYHEFEAFFRKTNKTYWDFKKINWKGNKGELNYFINCIKFEIVPSNIWEIAATCILVKGKEITAAELMNNRSISNSRKKRIDEIISEFKNPTTT